jgi:hypothetical protein
MAPRNARKRTGNAVAAAPPPKRPRRNQKQKSISQSPSETLKTESMSQSTDLQPSMNQKVIILEPDTVAIRPIRTTRTIGKEFPVFIDGDVYIKLGEDRKYCYKLHSSVLRRASSWFRQNLLEKPAEFDDEQARQVTSTSGISVRYELSYTPDFTMGYLVRKVKDFLLSQRLNSEQYLGTC